MVGNHDAGTHQEKHLRLIGFIVPCAGGPIGGAEGMALSGNSSLANKRGKSASLVKSYS